MPVFANSSLVKKELKPNQTNQKTPAQQIPCLVRTLKGCDAEVYDYSDNQGHIIFQSLVYCSLFSGEKAGNGNKFLNSEQQNQPFCLTLQHAAAFKFSYMVKDSSPLNMRITVTTIKFSLKTNLKLEGL